MPSSNKSNYRVVIPSINNSKTVLSYDLFDKSTLVVPKDQYSDYKTEYGSKSVYCYPEGCTHLYEVRNWIRSHFTEEWIFMVDDNVDVMMRMYPQKNTRERNIESSSIVTEIIERTIEATSSYGAYLFGFSESTTHNHYDVFNPVSTFGFVSTKAFGIHKDMEFQFKGDHLQGHWMTGINAFKYRKFYIDNRYAFRKLRGTISRTPESEWEKLHDAFGKNLFKKKESCENDILNKVL